MLFRVPELDGLDHVFGVTIFWSMFNAIISQIICAHVCLMVQTIRLTKHASKCLVLPFLLQILLPLAQEKPRWQTI